MLPPRCRIETWAGRLIPVCALGYGRWVESQWRIVCTTRSIRWFAASRADVEVAQGMFRDGNALLETFRTDAARARCELIEQAGLEPAGERAKG